VNSRLYSYSLPDLKLTGSISTGQHPHWMTITPDGKTIYVANSGEDTVSAIDVASRKEVSRIKVGHQPKRNLVVLLPSTNWD
jgi:YVTN family beta-propeller protein